MCEKQNYRAKLTEFADSTLFFTSAKMKRKILNISDHTYNEWVEHLPFAFTSLTQQSTKILRFFQLSEYSEIFQRHNVYYVTTFQFSFTLKFHELFFFLQVHLQFTERNFKSREMLFSLLIFNSFFFQKYFILNLKQFFLSNKITLFENVLISVSLRAFCRDLF